MEMEGYCTPIAVRATPEDMLWPSYCVAVLENLITAVLLGLVKHLVGDFTQLTDVTDGW